MSSNVNLTKNTDLNTVDRTRERRGQDYFSVAKEISSTGFNGIGISGINEMISEYVDHPDRLFGAKEWKRYFNVDVGEVPELSDDFYQFWEGPDPIDRTKRVCETYLPPVFCPRLIKDLSTNELDNYNLRNLGNISGQFQSNQGGASGPGHWIVMRKELLFRGSPLIAQQSRLMEHGLEEPSALDLATVVIARNALAKERYLGDASGAENRETWSRCKEVQKEEFRGERFQWKVNIGNFSENGLKIRFSNEYQDSIGVADVRRF